MITFGAHLMNVSPIIRMINRGKDNFQTVSCVQLDAQNKGDIDIKEIYKGKDIIDDVLETVKDFYAKQSFIPTKRPNRYIFKRDKV